MDHSAHQRVQHKGVKETFTEIRAKYMLDYWRKKSCLIHHPQAYVIRGQFKGWLFTAPLCSTSTSVVSCHWGIPHFACRAIDFAGQCTLKCGYVCFPVVTRAIHNKLAIDLTTATFVWHLKRFSAHGKGGLPGKITSDNSKGFKVATKLIKTFWPQGSQGLLVICWG